ncbi:hypothetical protein [Vibrio crassostreae]|uniref:hypothetical protein n=1 Tax=Vibrio crassostreae TaxID=246167 RepID=UPI001B304048|nr:hypothetical protein [Vibrio crassostreae]
MKNKILALTVIASSMGAHASEQATVVEEATEANTTAFEQFDNLNNEINIWTKKGELESAKKSALADELENVQLHKAIDEFKSTGGFAADEADDQKVSAMYSQDPYTAQDNTPSTSFNQEQILSANGVEGGLSEDVQAKINKLEAKQTEFFAQIQDYINQTEVRHEQEQAQAMENAENETQEGEEMEIDNNDPTMSDSMESKPASGNMFQYSQEEIKVGARIKKVTPTSTEVIFNVYFDDEEMNIFIVKAFDKDTKSFDLVLEDNTILKVKVLSIGSRKVKLKVDDKIIYAM